MFEVQLISPLGSIQESYTQVISFSSKALTGFSFTAVPYQGNLEAMHEIALTTPYYMPPSQVQTKATDLVSYIKITYIANGGTIYQDLGYGYTVPTRIPCKALKGLNPVTDVNINCTFYPGTSPYVIVQNYGEVAANGELLFLVPIKKNHLTNINFNLKIITKQNRLLTINSASTISLTFLTPSSVINTNLDGETAAFYTYTNRSINSDFSIDFLSKFSDVINGNFRVLIQLPLYDVGYLPEEGQVTCRIGSVSFNCYQFGMGLDWVYGSFSSDQSITTNGTVDRWYISNLRWPRYDVITIPGNLFVKVYDVPVAGTPFRLRNSLKYNSLLSPTINSFLVTGLNVDKKRRKEMDSTYTFTFVANDDIPDGGTVKLDLPSSYNLIASFPPVQISYPEFYNYSSTQPVGSFYTANTITIYNIKKLARKTEFRIIIKGMRNPDVNAIMNTFHITSYLSTYIVNQKLNFISVLLEDPFTAGKIDVTSISVFPVNRLVSADYTFAFVPLTKLSSGSEIHIKFPSEYSGLPQNPFCNVWGGINTFEVCYRLVNEIIVKLDSAYNTDTIYLRINGITNPDVAVTSSFEVYSTYDGSTVDETKSDTATSRKIYLSTKASLLSMREFYYDPANEGEVAKYVMSFIPTNNIEKGMNIYIRFPDTFDLRLGKDVGIFVKSGLTGDIKTSLFERVITISGFNKYDLSSQTTIKVEVNGVINPNKPETGHSGFISVGTIYPGSNKFLDYLPKAGSVQTTSAAGWLTLNSIIPSNYYSRTTADYTVNLTVTQRVPKTEYGGSIFMDLPKNFELFDGQVKCSNITANLGISPKCVQEKRLITINGQPDELSSDVSFSLKKIVNPLDEVKTESFFVRTYEGFTREIIQRSFENLDPFKLSYFYPGPLIIVNDGQPIYAEKGTQTKDLYLVMTEICSLNLTFVPVTPGFTFVPSEINLNIGEVKVKFRVSIPMGFSEGEYVVEWVTKNDFDPPIYTPIRKTTVVVTGKGSIPMLISKVNDVPYLGNSLPIIFSLDYAPDIGVEVLVGLDKSYAGISLDKQSVQFLAGYNQNTFMIYFDDPSISIDKVTQSGAVTLQLIGVNKDIYSLPTNLLTFNVITRDIRTPEITDISLIEVTQTTVTIQFSCSDISTAYYILALKGTAQPDLEELKTFGPAEYETTQTRYGVYYVGQEQIGILQFDGLSAETEYVVYVLLEDRGFNQIEAPGFLEFKTKGSLSLTRSLQRRFPDCEIPPELHKLCGENTDLRKNSLFAEPQPVESPGKPLHIPTAPARETSPRPL